MHKISRFHSILYDGETEMSTKGMDVPILNKKSAADMTPRAVFKRQSWAPQPRCRNATAFGLSGLRERGTCQVHIGSRNQFRSIEWSLPSLSAQARCYLAAPTASLRGQGGFESRGCTYRVKFLFVKKKTGFCPGGYGSRLSLMSLRPTRRCPVAREPDI